MPTPSNVSLHVKKRTKSGGAYTHAAEFWQERVRMMRWWVDELDRPRELRLVRIRA
jgi:hypothetical protein